MLYQQGDVLFKRIKKLPKEKSPCINPVLVLGEATGHHHSIAVDQLEEALSDILYTDEHGDLYIKNKKDVTITHQEHAPVTLPPGNWKVDRVVEYDHFREEARQVMD